MILLSLSWLWLGAESRDRVTIALAMWGKQVVVTVAATIAVEGNDDAHDNLDQTEIEITDLNT